VSTTKFKHFTLKILILFSFFLWTSCKGQKVKSTNNTIDTLKLFDPKPELVDTILSSFEIYKNCIGLKPEKNDIVFNENQNILNKGKDFENFLESHQTELKRQKLYILFDSRTKYSEVMDVIDLLQKLKVENYKVIDLEIYYKSPPQAGEVKISDVNSNKIDTTDSANFIIEIFDNSIDVRFFNKTRKLRNPKELDKFIHTNRKNIDTKKIFVKSFASLPYDKFKGVKTVLKKYEFYKFQIIVNEN
jgi:biopolymer transport protein ExbD